MTLFLKLMHTQEEINKATEFLQNLQSFTNKEVSEINDGKPCNDKTRDSIIIEMIADEFGDSIFQKMRVKL